MAEIIVKVSWLIGRKLAQISRIKEKTKIKNSEEISIISGEDLLSLANQPQRRTGNIGNTQGANTDNTPAKKAKNRIIFVYSKNKAYSKSLIIFSYSPDSSLEIRLRSWSIRMKV